MPGPILSAWPRGSDRSTRVILGIAGVALALALGGCGDAGEAGGGLEARLFETEADEVSAGPGGVFVTEGADLAPIDIESGEPAGDPIDIGALNTRLAIGEEAGWVTDVNEHEAARIDLSNGSRQALAVPGGDPVAVAALGSGALIASGRELIPYAADGSPGPASRLPCDVYDFVGSEEVVAGGCEDGVVTIDAAGTVGVVNVGGEPDSVAVTSGSVWALIGGRLVEVGADGKRGRTLKAPDGAVSIAAEGQALWVLSGPGGDDEPELVTLHDARTGKLEAGPVELPGGTSDVGAAAATVAPFQGSLWFTLAFYGGPLGVVEPVGP